MLQINRTIKVVKCAVMLIGHASNCLNKHIAVPTTAGCIEY